jgi:L-ascorbate 6-phosphate lactonase
MDFDPNEGYVFPQPVELKKSSTELKKEIEELEVPKQTMALWYLGNTTFILKTSANTVACLDPYLSDFCASKYDKKPTPKSRLLPLFLEPHDLTAEVILLTHSHCDHTDPLTLKNLEKPGERLFIAPFQCIPILQSIEIPSYSVQLIHPGQTLTLKDLTITATFAEPTDDQELNPVGYWVRASDGPSIYFTGDTAPSERLGAGVTGKPDVMTVCINGGYHNLSHWEAAELAQKIQPTVAVPNHFDMMPHNIQPPHMFRKSLWEKTKGGVTYCRMEYATPYFFGPHHPLQKSIKD